MWDKDMRIRHSTIQVMEVDNRHALTLTEREDIHPRREMGSCALGRFGKLFGKFSAIGDAALSIGNITWGLTTNSNIRDASVCV